MKNRKSSKSNTAEAVVILGSTGSVGRSTLSVLREQGEAFRILGLAAGHAGDDFVRQAAEFHPKYVALRDRAEVVKFARLLDRAKIYSRPEILSGDEGLERLASLRGVKKVVNALSGAAGIRPSIAAVRAGKTLLVANKEAIVAAGEPIFKEAQRGGATVLPVDSEHSAVLQCLRGEDARAIRKIILTSSGGPFFRRKSTSGITPQMALRHPQWKMGPKISVDSATLMNKGLEIIEAMRFFNMPEDRIQVLVHPECIVHSMVEYSDGATLAQLAEPDMRIPIRFALNYPDRVDVPGASLNLSRVSKLTFFEPDVRRFPCLELARAAAREMGLLPAALCAADEVAVDAFLRGVIGFDDIPRVIERVIDRSRSDSSGVVSLKSVLDADARARSIALREIRRLKNSH